MVSPSSHRLGVARGSRIVELQCTDVERREFVKPRQCRFRHSLHRRTVTCISVWSARGLCKLILLFYFMLLAALRRLISPSTLRTLPSMLATSTRPAPAGPNGKPTHHTVTALKRWSCDDKELPAAADVKAIHVYDFDNTLFASPLPNKQIWNQGTLGQLMAPDMFVSGGWWHDSSILAATGEGEEKEEARAWQGWWNEQIVSLVELSMEQKDALNVLLTGRSEHGFADLVKRMVRSKKLNFDMVCLKPSVGPAGQKFKSTMQFKQELLKDIVYTYKDAEEIRIYEDRVKQYGSTLALLPSC
jgi:hypothetical protein